jgi:hypothetical protein
MVYNNDNNDDYDDDDDNNNNNNNNNNVSCHRPFLPGTPSLEPTAIPTALASSFTLQYFPHYV